MASCQAVNCPHSVVMSADPKLSNRGLEPAIEATTEWLDCLKLFGLMLREKDTACTCQDIFRTSIHQLDIKETDRQWELHQLKIKRQKAFAELKALLLNNCDFYTGDWKAIGIFLGLSSVALKEVGLNNSWKSVQCEKEVFRMWLDKASSTTGSRPWNILCSALDVSGNGHIAVKLLEHAIQTAGTDYYPRLFFFINPSPLDWYQMGVKLGISSDVLESIKYQHENIPELCSKEMLIRWLSEDHGTGSKPRTWDTVVFALKEVVTTATADRVSSRLKMDLKDDFLKKAPNIADLKEYVIPYILPVWHILGQQLEIHRLVLKEIEEYCRSRRIPTHKMASEMLQRWLRRDEGSGDAQRTWATIMKALIQLGHSNTAFDIIKKIDPSATDKDICRVLSALEPASNDDVVLDNKEESRLAVLVSTELSDTEMVESFQIMEELSSLTEDFLQNLMKLQQEKEGCCSRRTEGSEPSDSSVEPPSDSDPGAPGCSRKRTFDSREEDGPSQDLNQEESQAQASHLASHDSHMKWSEPKRRLLERVPASAVIRSFWTQIIDHLNLLGIKDHLYKADFISDDDLDQMQSPHFTKEKANSLVLTRLRNNGTGETLIRFAKLLRETDPTTYPKHVLISEEIEASLNRCTEEDMFCGRVNKLHHSPFP